MSWWQLSSILKEQEQDALYWREQLPVACPFDGTPLLEGPPQHEAVRYCPNGDFTYPRDWDPDSMSGM